MRGLQQKHRTCDVTLLAISALECTECEGLCVSQPPSCCCLVLRGAGMFRAVCVFPRGASFGVPQSPWNTLFTLVLCP